MDTRKERLTVTVDPELIEAGKDAVAEGRAESLSGWVNAALAEWVARERRLLALPQAVDAYEQQFGVISRRELADQARADRESAVVIRGNRAGRARRTARRRPPA